MLPTTTIRELLAKISEKEGISTDYIRLIFTGKQLYPQFPSNLDSTIEEKGIKKDNTLHIVLR